ncbi:galactofuranosylgalactofuranosylrhamnosyl-N-acetylglucosaminyl-diphospho-decaprenol beta-1,5/1,6-galactofuranosyltransferase [Geodermatophilus telluris]|uniref:Galactofuranosylgalactofuranosylrhamnosyl-N-acetylglucosaminyl-diphospho-decaprenol beta-1,5/1,6-galactofuranosyltransferase n=1 Tax=Geodermatophilus telluris TaxID=1190417 RepID=A0A1G6IH08_9ACTN|nr:glycosyltransferase [Geodermatophilus telluris]SDC05842.1 galactofuranosylgalactofuranosylrhamnosyl-N-acetylglucosaminyl-diphospho-decaprenol beta-1,5/1,6-galactofuranosyltransferase [Geodermatophilus telluris]
MTTTHSPVSPERVSELSAEDLASGKAVTLLQRVILPRPGDPLKVRSLYVDEDRTTRVRSATRGDATVAAGHEVSFATYFNAFPASYWRRWTVLREVVLGMTLSGPGRIDVYRSKADGSIIHVTGATTTGEDRRVEFELDLTPFVDGGWYWFDLTADDDSVTVRDAAWYAAQAPERDARLSVGICTFNRPDDCVAALRALAGDDVVRELISTVVVADQGNKKVRDAAGFAAVESGLEGRLRLVEQGNLGGSGGFSRTMYESLTHTDATHHLLLDDDVQLEPDSIARVFAFARFTKTPMLVGGQMLALQDRSVLHTMGEVVAPDKFFWRAAPNTEYAHDFAKENLRESEDLHRRVDVDYTGWWMCLIPREALERLGFALPVFIKWDDAEYGIRARENGFPVATLPGAAVWHLSWSDKDDTAGWQAYFHTRNRLVAAALHSQYKRGGTLLRDTFKFDLKFLIMLQYATAALHHRAYDDFLAGPSRLFPLLPTALPTALEHQGDYPDGRVLPSSSDLPLPSMGAVKAERFMKPPTTPVTIGRTLLGALVHNLRKPKPGAQDQPELNISAQDARWFLLSRLDSATVGTADGRGVTFRRREPDTFWRMLRHSIRVHVRLYREFPALAEQYRASLGELTSPESWEKAFLAEDVRG